MYKIMSNVINARVNVIKRLNVMVRRIEDISSFLVHGPNSCQPEEINAVVASEDKSSFEKIFTDLDFLIKTFLQPQGSDKQNVLDSIYANYRFADGLELKLCICGVLQYPDADWYVSYLDKTGSSDAFYTGSDKYMSDPVAEGIIPKEDVPEEDELPDEFDLTDNTDFDNDFDDDLEEVNDYVEDVPTAAQFVPDISQPSEPETDDFYQDDFTSEPIAETVEVQPEPVEVQPQPVEVQPEPVEVQPQPLYEAPAEPEPESRPSGQRPEPTSDEMWEYIYGRVSVAKRAIAGGSVFYAIEIVNELRNEIVKIICKKNGISSDYYRSIDLLSNDYRKQLSKTYPANAEPGAIVTALAAELAMFEQLI